MKRHRPLLLFLLLVYIFAPTLLSWVTHPEGDWYRPYFLWLLVVVIAYLLQDRSNDTV